MAWETPELHQVGHPLEVPEAPPLPPAPAPAPHRLPCPAPSASTMSVGGSQRAASPRRMTRDSVSIPTIMAYAVLNKLARRTACMAALTQFSSGIVHHTYPRAGGWILSSIPSTAHRPRIEQESPYYYDIRPEYGQSQAAQGTRKCKRHLFDRQIMAHGRSLSSGELRAP
jgi:hypothetical protein